MPDYSDTRIQFRRGSYTQWTNSNPVLGSGEPGFDLTNNVLKVGDGSTQWASLSGVGGGGGSGGGSTTFVGLLDTPSNFTGAGSKIVAVNSAASALEYIAASSLSITESQISDFGSYLTSVSISDIDSNVIVTETEGIASNDNDTTIPTSAAVKAYVDANAGGSEVNDLSSAVTWVNVPDANITESSVVQHSGALRITESQIVDLGHTTVNIPKSGDWNTAYDTLVAQSGNWNTAYSWGDHSDQDYLTAVSGDTSPSLSNNLDVNNYSLINVSGINGDGTNDTILVGSHLIPSGNSIFDLGEASRKFRHLYLSNSSIKFVGSDETVRSLSVNGDGNLDFNSSVMASRTYVDTKVADLVNSAPETLDTLDELAAAINDNADILDTLSTKTELTSASGNLQTQITTLNEAGYLTSESNNLTSSVTWANVPDANITESSVVQHSGALQITKSQITDFGTYLTAVADDISPFLGGELNLDNNDVVIDCRNDSGSDILAGTPVYVSGYYANGKSLIAPADASSSSTMPAIGIVNSTITNGNEGTVGIMGVAKGFSTNSFEVGDTVYIANGGGLTNIKPTGVSDLIQNLGRVLRKDANNGSVILLGAGRSNDVPNSATFTGDVEAASFTKTGGASSEFLKADGSVDSSTYLTSHPTISAASSVDNSNGNVIQDITLDSNGHVTVLGSIDLDGRYYTETEIDAFNYLANVVEDTTPQLGGNLDLQTYDITSDITTGGDIKLGYHTGIVSGTTYTIITDNANQKVGINIDSPSYALDIGQGNNVYSTTSEMRVQQIVPLTSLLLGTAHALSVTTPQGGHYNSVSFGTGAAPTISKGISYATNYFSVAGDAQKVSTVVQYESTDASTYYLNAAKTGSYLYSSYVRNDTFLLPPDSSATFTIHLIANNDTDGTSAGWIFRGCVKSVNKSLSFVGSPITENFADGGMSSATAAIEVQDGSGISAFKRGGLVIKVNGLASKTIRWVATIDAVLTSF